MKKVFLSALLVTAFLATAISSIAVAETKELAEPKKGATLSEWKAKWIPQIEANLKKDQALKECVQKAQNPSDISVCRGKDPKSGAAKPGPKFAETKEKNLQQIDSVIKMREARKACAEKAQTVAEIKNCKNIK